MRASIEFYTYQDCLKIYILLIQPFQTFVQAKYNKVSAIEERHLVEELDNAWAGGSRFERVGSQNFGRKWSNWLPVEIIFQLQAFIGPGVV